MSAGKPLCCIKGGPEARLKNWHDRWQHLCTVLRTDGICNILGIHRHFLQGSQSFQFCVHSFIGREASPAALISSIAAADPTAIRRGIHEHWSSRSLASTSGGRPGVEQSSTGQPNVLRLLLSGFSCFDRQSCRGSMGRCR